MDESPDDELARLRAENAALRARIEASAPRPEGSSDRQRSWRSTALATVLIVVGAIIAPIGIVANWARVELSDTDAFVTTFAPLSKDPAVRSFVAAEVVTAVNKRIDIAGVTDDLFAGVEGLGLGPKATTALNLLKAPAVKGAESLVSSTVDRFVDSQRFSTLWRNMLQTGHVQLVDTMSNDRKAIVAIGANGALGIQLGPVIAEVKSLLLRQGLTLADRIPTVNRTIIIATTADAVAAQRWYALVIALGTWLPFVALALLISGVAVARRRAVATLWAAVALALAMLLTLAGIGVGRAIVVRHLSPDLMPADVARAMYQAVVAFMVSSSIAVVVLVLSVALVAWWAGSSTAATALRRASRSGGDALRALGDSRGVTTGRFGRGLYRQRMLVRVLVGVCAAALIIAVRPLSATLIVWTLIGAAVLLAVFELLQRPDQSAA